MNALLIAGLVAVALGLLIRAAVLLLRWARKNREEAAAMMLGTYLKDVPEGFAPPSRKSIIDALGEWIDACDSASSSSHDGLASAVCPAVADVSNDGACHESGSVCAD